MAELIQKIDMKIGTLSIFKGNAASIEITDTDNITEQDVINVILNCEKIIEGPYGLISDRKQEYSVDPSSLYQILTSRERLKCAAIVSYRSNTEMFFPVEENIEGHISQNQIPLKLFHTLDSAVEWVQEYISSCN